MSKRSFDDYNPEVHAAVGKRHSPTNEGFEAASEQMRIAFERQLEIERQQRVQAQQNEQLAEVTNERLFRQLQQVQQRLNLCEDDNRSMVNRIAELQRQQAAELGAAREAREIAEKQLEEALNIIRAHGIMPVGHLNMLYKTDIKF